MLTSLFWLDLLVIVYAYFGYPALLWAMTRVTGRRTVPACPSGATARPGRRVSLVIAAYNEEAHIADKLENSLALDDPADGMEIVVASDGSTDRTAAIVRGYAERGVRLLDLRANVGKAAAQNAAVGTATGEILVFSDADVSVGRDAVRRLVRHFDDPAVGCVTGQVVYTNEEATGVSRGEGAYWRYEVRLREWESRLGILVAGSGALLAVRRALFEPLDADVSEDFFLPMRAALRGYRTVYEPGAVATTPLHQAHPREMFRARVRTITLDTRSVWLCRAILNPWRHPWHALGVVSHKVLRWLVPYLLLALLAINAMLSGHDLYGALLGGQIAFYVIALAGYWRQRRGRPLGASRIPFFFCLVNAAVAVGVARFVAGGTSGRWAPVRER